MLLAAFHSFSMSTADLGVCAFSPMAKAHTNTDNKTVFGSLLPPHNLMGIPAFRFPLILPTQVAGGES